MSQSSRTACRAPRWQCICRCVLCRCAPIPSVYARTPHRRLHVRPGRSGMAWALALQDKGAGRKASPKLPPQAYHRRLPWLRWPPLDAALAVGACQHSDPLPLHPTCWCCLRRCQSRTREASMQRDVGVRHAARHSIDSGECDRGSPWRSPRLMHRGIMDIDVLCPYVRWSNAPGGGRKMIARMCRG